MPIRSRSSAVIAALLVGVVVVGTIAAADRLLGDRTRVPPLEPTVPAGVAPGAAGVLRHPGVPPSAREAAFLGVLAQRGVPAREVGGTAWVTFFRDVIGGDLGPDDGRWV